MCENRKSSLIILNINGEQFILESDTELTMDKKNYIEAICETIYDESNEWYEDIYDHELYPVFKNVLPNYLIKDHFGEGNDDIEVDDSVEYLIEDSVKVNVYGFDVESKDSIMLQTLENNISEGGIDKEKFANGEDVVVLMPLYDINPDVEIKRINMKLEDHERSDTVRSMKSKEIVLEKIMEDRKKRHKED